MLARFRFLPLRGISRLTTTSMTALEKDSPCKVNLLLNILGRRPDGFHELETVLYPIRVCDRLIFAAAGSGSSHLSCNAPSLPTDARNLVYRAAAKFLEAAKIRDGVRLELQKKIPLAAGLGGGSGNAATTLARIERTLWRAAVAGEQLQLYRRGSGLRCALLPAGPAGAGDRPGRADSSLGAFPALSGAAFLLIHPGFGIATAWAYQRLARFPSRAERPPGRAQKLDHPAAAADLESGRCGVLQLARSAGAGKVSAPGFIPGISSGTTARRPRSCPAAVRPRSPSSKNWRRRRRSRRNSRPNSVGIAG